jgi:hypothetical protein
MSKQIISQLFERRVKGGDVLKLPIFTDDDSANIQGWHLIRIDDLHLSPIANSNNDTKNVINKVRPKLKGSGAVPLSPLFKKNNDIHDNNASDDTQIIYTVPNAKYYKIVTTGCQMNVADSERIMGVLEGELGLTSLDENCIDDTLALDKTTSRRGKKNNNSPDVLLLNTCTIRDHAEQKVYDALGPYAAMKRNGKPLAIVVAGCVAQQEGELYYRFIVIFDYEMIANSLNTIALYRRSFIASFPRNRPSSRPAIHTLALRPTGSSWTRQSTLHDRKYVVE